MKAKTSKSKPTRASAKPTLLSGGNPQIAKADGDRGTSLRSAPPGEYKRKGVRYLDIHEDDPLDEKQLASWIKQAASMPGWDGGSLRSGGSPL